MLHVHFYSDTQRALERTKERIEERYPLLNVIWSRNADSYSVNIFDDYGEQTKGMYDILCHYLELYATMLCNEAHLVLIDTSLPPLLGSRYSGRELINHWINWRIEDED